MKDKTIGVLGAGIAGLSAAAFLAREGAEVTVIEKNDQVGGRASVLEEEGFRFDMGPSWYLMPDVFERFFGKFGKEPGDYYGLTRLEPNYRIFFKDGDVMDVPADPGEVEELFERYEEGAGERFQAYLDESEKNYRTAMEEFVLEDRSSLRDFLSLDVLKGARGIKLLGSMQDHVENYFENPKLQQVMQYSLVFLGGAPDNTPALYNLMSHVDFNQGVYYPEGGIYSVIEGLEQLAREQGAEFLTGEEVSRIDRGEKLEVETEEDSYSFDAVVSNIDYAYTETRLLPEKYRSLDSGYWDRKTLAPSAFLVYLGLDRKLEKLEHHSLVLPTDWDDHFEKIFDEPGWPEDPAYYICYPSATDDTVAPEGKSALFVLVPVAAGLEDDEETRGRFRDLVISDMERNTGEDIEEAIEYEKVFSISDFEERYNSYRGTALGLAHTLRQTAFFRPSHRSGKMEGLYYTGAYTNPGIGMPMCLISGEHTAEKVKEDFE